MRKILLLTSILAGGLSTANAGKAVLIKLDRYQWGFNSERPDDEYCIVCEDVEDGSKMKLKRCDDPYQDNTKLWVIDGKYWKAYRDPSLCVEAASIENNERLYLMSCDGGSKQRWTLPDIDSDGRIKPKRSDSLNVAFESIGDGPGGSAAKPGDKITLSSWSDPDWIISPVDVDSSGDDDYRIGPCRHFQLEDDKGFCMGVDYPVTPGRRVELERCRENDGSQLFCPDSLGRFHSKEDNGLCLQVDADNDLSLDRCRGYYREQFDRVTARSSYPSSDALYPSMDTGSCVTYAGSSPQMRRSIVTTNGCSTQWIHFQPPPPDLNDCRETKFRLRGTNLCAGAVGRYVFQDDGNIELMSCGRDETRFCLLKSGQVQALEAFAEGTRNGYFEAHEDVNLLLQNGHVIPRQIIKFRTNGKIKSGIGQCLTTDSHWNPREGDRVMSKRCRVGLKWDVVGADDADNDDDPKYTICKFKLKKSGSLCAGNVDNDELHLMSCDDDDTRMKWGRNGLIQSTAGGDTYWESCSGSRRGSPPSNCQVILQNRADNGEQEFVLSGSDLILKGNTDACVTYEGNYPNAGDRLYLEDCDDVTNTRWVAKCDD